MFCISKYILKFSVKDVLFSNFYIKKYSSTVKSQIQSYHLYKLKSGPSTEVSVTKDEALKFYREMNIIRKMEAVSSTLYTEKLIRGFLHLYSGQEAICVGMKAALEPQDTAITAYRAHGWTYIMGETPEGVIGELLGRAIGCSKGKGGSMHTYAPNFYGGNGIVGAQVPVGTGLAFAHKYRGDKGVSVTLYGDGAANQGQVFEAFNIAKLQNLPVIYVCENNLYGMGTSTERSSANNQYYTRGDYIPGIKADGMDIIAVKEVTRFARDYVLKNGPIIIEFVTYRYFGHSMSDPGISYRSREEIQSVRQKRDPISTLKEKILKTNLATAEELQVIEKETKTIIDEAVKKCLNSKELEISELFCDIYANDVIKSIKNCKPWNPGQHKITGKPKNLK